MAEACLMFPSLYSQTAVEAGETVVLCFLIKSVTQEANVLTNV